MNLPLFQKLGELGLLGVTVPEAAAPRPSFRAARPAVTLAAVTEHSADCANLASLAHFAKAPQLLQKCFPTRS